MALFDTSVDKNQLAYNNGENRLIFNWRSATLINQSIKSQNY
jgi:hypothetical protein